MYSNKTISIHYKCISTVSTITKSCLPLHFYLYNLILMLIFVMPPPGTHFIHQREPDEPYSTFLKLFTCIFVSYILSEWMLVPFSCASRYLSFSWWHWKSARKCLLFIPLNSMMYTDLICICQCILFHHVICQHLRLWSYMTTQSYAESGLVCSDVVQLHIKRSSGSNKKSVQLQKQL